MSGSPVFAAALKATQALGAAGFPYALFGGLALPAWGRILLAVWMRRNSTAQIERIWTRSISATGPENWALNVIWAS